MKLLLDTHTLIWWLMSDARLSERARAALDDSQSVKVVSTVSVWEIAIKVRAGKMPCGPVVESELPGTLQRIGFEELQLTWAHGDKAGRLEGAHKDPFDRMLAAQALIEGMPLVTADPAFRAFGVAVIW